MGICNSDESKQDDGSETIKHAKKYLNIYITGARGVRQLKWFPDSKCLLFCTVGIPGKEGILCRTKQVKDSPAPIWREEFTVKEYEEGQTLEFTVWEMTDGRRDALAKTYLQALNFDPNGFCGELPLDMSDEDSKAFLKIKVRLAKGSYPVEAPQEYLAALVNPKKVPLGIDFDLQDGQNVYIAGLKTGLIQTYNETAEADAKIQPGDFIVRANKTEGNAAKVLETLRSDIRLELMLRRPEEKVVAIAVPDGDWEDMRGPERKKPRGGFVACTCGSPTEDSKREKFGLEFNRKPAGQGLVITKVVDGGPVDEWNHVNPDQEVAAGDRIVAINGDKGTAQELLTKLRAMDRYVLSIVRPAADDRFRDTPSTGKRVNWNEEVEERH